MSILAFQDLLLGTAGSHDAARKNSTIRHPQQSSLSLRPKSSLANLLAFAKNPFENAGETVEDWLDGSTKEERAQKQALEDRKQLLYIKLKTVRSVPPIHPAVAQSSLGNCSI